MTKARLDGLYLVLLGSLVFILLGFTLGRTTFAPLRDFKYHYCAARCILQRSDPYDQRAVFKVYRQEGENPSKDPPWVLTVETLYNNFPTAFSFTIPIALLPLDAAMVFWEAATAGLVIFAALLMFDIGADFAPILSGGLIGFLLANSEQVLGLGNVSGIAISLCVIAVWCFCRDRFAAVGVVCLAISLALKPQGSGFIWLYFLLAGGAHRRRALMVLAAMFVLCAPGVLWLTHVAPHWMTELPSNIRAWSAPGASNEPRPDSAIGFGRLINLQPAIRMLQNDPRFYNWTAYVICGVPLFAWAIKTTRVRPSLKMSSLAIAVAALLTLLPVYHRTTDAMLLLLTVPACATLWKTDRRLGRFGLVATALSLVVAEDNLWLILSTATERVSLLHAGLSGRILTALTVVSLPLILFAAGIFYLWVFLQQASDEVDMRKLEPEF